MAGRVLARFLVREGLLAGLNMPGTDMLRRGARKAMGLRLGLAAPVHPQGGGQFMPTRQI